MNVKLLDLTLFRNKLKNLNEQYTFNEKLVGYCSFIFYKINIL